MNIYVCIKSTPTSDSISFDAEGNMRRSDSSMQINPFDLVAVESALRLKEKYGGKVTAVSMGPRSAEGALRTAIAMGADSAVLLSDAAFAGADVPATARTLAAFFNSLQNKDLYDIIICGNYSSDGDTGQTGAMLAECIRQGIPHAASICSEITIEDGKMRAMQRLEGIEREIRLNLPALAIMENDAFYPRDITLRGTLAAKRALINTIDNNTLHIDPECCGIKGSACRVIKIFGTRRKRQGKIIKADEMGKVLVKRGLGV
ncbi:MAG: electron transfer flavoprotein subunit beta/FixA family protein [Spirochaetaceae bacterium]|jgi:electron transfer flavoprotein beta subunit|nr:electron transfer flavoprotein subunit beta/FixA family protein [Spirochaetaceae bacterium]